MYHHHWGLAERPFQNSCNPAYLYRWGGHEEVISRLRYSLEGDRGLVLVTGPTGCGKSFLCRIFAEGVRAKGTRVCLIVNPVDDPEEILLQVQGGLGVEKSPQTRADMIHSIEEAAAESSLRDERTLILIDDAHLLLDRSIPKVLRQLLNLEENGKSLINLVLAGQEPLAEGVEGSTPLAQRVAIRARVDPLPAGEVGGYVAHRLKVGGRSKNPFKADAIDEIVIATGGVPRAINDLCDVVLFSAWGGGKKSISKTDIDEAIGDVIAVEKAG